MEGGFEKELKNIFIFQKILKPKGDIMTTSKETKKLVKGKIIAWKDLSSLEKASFENDTAKMRALLGKKVFLLKIIGKDAVKIQTEDGKISTIHRRYVQTDWKKIIGVPEVNDACDVVTLKMR